MIPVPDVLNFGTATLLAAACCIPAILSMVSMWNKILEINWKRRWGDNESEERLDEQIEGTNGATVGRMRHVNGVIRMFLSAIEAPLFIAAVLAILIVGELNFFSDQVYYETEPMASIGRSNSISDIAPVIAYQLDIRTGRLTGVASHSDIGQWAPMVGTFLAALGSFHILAAGEGQLAKGGPLSPASVPPCTCSHHPGDIQSVHSSPRGSRDHEQGTQHAIYESPQQKSLEINDGDIANARLYRLGPHHSCAPSHGERADSIELGQVATPDAMHTIEEVNNAKSQSRLKVALALNRFGEYIGTPRSDFFDISAFRKGEAASYPVVPGEKSRVANLYRLESQYKDLRHMEEEYIPERRRQRSRAGSFTNAEPVSPMLRSISPNRPQSGRSLSRAPHPAGQAPRSQTLPTEPTAHDSCELILRHGSPKRRGTLEVPSPDHHHPSTWAHLNILSSSGPSAIPPSKEQSPPMIVVSPDPETASYTSHSIPAGLEAQSLPPRDMPHPT